MTVYKAASMKRSSYRNILKNTLQVGGSSVVSLFFSMIRSKLLAVQAGPESIGLLGLFTSVIRFCSTISAFGLSQSGIRTITQAAPEERKQIINDIRLYGLLLSSIGFFFTLGFSHLLASMLFKTPLLPIYSYFLASGAFITVFTTSVVIELSTQHKIKQLATSTLVSAFLSTSILVPYLLFGGALPEIIFATTPVLIHLSVLFWMIKTHSQYPIEIPTLSPSTWKTWVSVFCVGFPLMLGVLFSVATNLVLNSIIETRASLAALGFFVAIATISEKSMSIVLKSMSFDYFPRLSEAANDTLNFTDLANRQIRILLALGTPLVILIAVMPEFWLGILYSNNFKVAAPVLQFFIIGNYFMLITWPVGLMIVAKGQTIIALIKDVIVSFYYILIIYFLFTDELITLGLLYLSMRIFHTTIIYALAGSLYKFRPSKFVMLHIAISAIFFVSLLFFNIQDISYYPLIAVVLFLLAAGFTIYDLKTLTKLK